MIISTSIHLTNRGTLPLFLNAVSADVPELLNVIT
jgi:hypothetical protein